MKRLKRPVAYILAVLLSLSSFPGLVPVSAGAEAKESGKVLNEQKAEEQEEIEQRVVQVSVSEGKGCIQVEDEAGNVSETTVQQPLSLDCSPGSILDVKVIPESGYQIAFYKTLTDTGEAEEVTLPMIEENCYSTQVNVDQVTSIQAGFSEKDAEKSGEDQETEADPEDMSEDPPEDEMKAAAAEDYGELPDYAGVKIPYGYSLSPARSRGISLFATTADNIVDLIVGDEVPWSNYHTRHYSLTDGSTAFCLQPMKKYPDSGVHEITEIRDNKDEITKVLYYGYGGPGWDQAGIDQGDFNSNYTVTHLMGSYIYNDYKLGMDSFGVIDYAHVKIVLEAYEKVMDMPDPPEDAVAMLFDTGHNSETGQKSQVMVVLGYRQENGCVEVQKSSADPEITWENSAYGSLAGAEYGLYIHGTEELVAVLVTDEKGYAKAEDIPAGNYDIREIKAPAGFVLDTATGSVTVTAGQTTVYRCQDKPQSASIDILLNKIDAETDQGKSQESLSLANAEFMVKFYKGLYEKDPGAEGIKPEKTWKMKTDDNGEVHLSEKYKISGDEFYKSEEGPVLPLGTVTIQETKAPAGYLINNEIFVRQITSEGNTESAVTYSQPTVPETSQKGIIRLLKEDSETDRAQGEGSLEGAVYEVRNSSNKVVSTITTDREGKGESERLPLGTYTVKEKTASPGYQADPQTYTVKLTARDTTTEVFYKSVTSKEDIIRGGAAVEKWDSELNKKEPQGGASLEDTQLQIISQNDQEILVDGESYRKGEVITTLTTDKDGKASTAADLLPYGSYQLKEVKQPGGYTSAGTTVRNFEIRENGKIVQMNTSDTAIKNEVIRGGVAVEKWDNELDQRIPQGDAGLEEAQIQIISRNEQTVLVGEKEYKNGEVVATLTIDKDGKASTAADLLPYGDYQLKETVPPAGYTSGGTITRNFEIREEGQIVRMTDTDTAIKNEVIRGGITIAKWSQETNERKPQGGAALGGAKFTVTNRSAKAVLVDGQLYQPGEVIARVETGEDGFWTSANDWLPYGTYEVVEVQAPDGYLPDGVQPKTFQIRENGQILSLDNNEGAIKNQVKRGDLNFVKVADSTLERLANISFKITSKTTGESHVVVSDINGQVDTSSAWNPHSQNTNRGETSEDGVWFSGTTEKEVPVNDEKGALPYDTYLIEEQRCEANQGYKLLSIEITVYRDNYTIPLGTLTDDSDLVEITTTAIDSDTEDHYAVAGENTTIIDNVEYTNLTEGEKYTLKGSLMNKETGKPVTDNKGNPVTAEKTFTAKRVNGTAEMEFTLDSTKLAGADIVVFEELYQKENLIAEHRDITDEDQTIHFPEIGTKAMDRETNSNMAKADEEITLVDTVFYKNLQPGKKYKLIGTLMDKETGEPVKDIDRKEITAETSFKPETSDGTVNVTFTFDSSNLAGKTIVVFERLERNDTVYAVHTDINDQAQTIYFPEIGTTALDQENGTHNSNSDSKVTIVDTVTYKGLIPGKEYTVKGTLMDKSSGAELLVDGKPVTAEKTFTAEEADGTVEIVFTFDGRSLAGQQVVVYEELYTGDNLIGEHKDINDEGQTVTFPQLHTNASDGITGNHTGTVSEKATVIDTVTYTGLLPGKEYTVKGTLMDKETGEPVKDSKGKEITAEKTFTAEKADGSVELAFTFDSTALKNSAVVVFERLYVDDKEVAAHTDINDKGQTVEYTEHKIQTQAKDKESGSQEAKTSGTASVKTGDEAPIAELFCVLVFSGVVTAVMVKKKRSKRRRHLKP